MIITVAIHTVVATDGLAIEYDVPLKRGKAFRILHAESNTTRTIYIASAASPTSH